MNTNQVILSATLTASVVLDFAGLYIIFQFVLHSLSQASISINQIMANLDMLV